MNPKHLTSTEREIYREAQKMLAKEATAVGFSERFFGPSGSLQKLWKNEAERKKVVVSELYQWLSQRLAELRTQEAKAFEQEVETFSGRLTIVVPKSLHAALKREAMHEGVSLSELIRLKLLSCSSGGLVIKLVAELVMSNLMSKDRQRLPLVSGRRVELHRSDTEAATSELCRLLHHSYLTSAPGTPAGCIVTMTPQHIDFKR